MDMDNPDLRLSRMEGELAGVKAMTRLALAGLALLALLMVAGAIGLAYLSGEVQQQQKASVARPAGEVPLNDHMPPGPQSQPAPDEEP
jgi:hypothetical protein